MSCCGKARAQAKRTVSNPTVSNPKAKPALSVAPQPQALPAAPATQSVYFTYAGNTSLTVTGPVSRRVYRFFANSGAMAVDARDAASLARVPNLRQIQHL
jgi:hypothetical protein